MLSSADAGDGQVWGSGEREAAMHERPVRGGGGVMGRLGSRSGSIPEPIQNVMLRLVTGYQPDSNAARD
jgi:hypothetical protein